MYLTCYDVLKAKLLISENVLLFVSEAWEGETAEVPLNTIFSRGNAVSALLLGTFPLCLQFQFLFHSHNWHFHNYCNPVRITEWKPVAVNKITKLMSSVLWYSPNENASHSINFNAIANEENRLKFWLWINYYGMQTFVHPNICLPVTFARGGDLFTRWITTPDICSPIQLLRQTFIHPDIHPPIVTYVICCQTE